MEVVAQLFMIREDLNSVWEDLGQLHLAHDATLKFHRFSLEPFEGASTDVKAEFLLLGVRHLV